ncbi:PA14 domain-containing protein [Nostoc sp. FACHB-110]|uniref:PA14 domain-containing protein n=1 Tax=Nostoc sp. FACHB-110 TaxID=2692834 RepID=UPI001685818F|nr:PA14 domain-containing protein [Nostoc sp. FACHB-110]MBD2441494.1 PQQ-dependent sugar dehydrogenase [Nostoc sp. FACHB-110]
MNNTSPVQSSSVLGQPLNSAIAPPSLLSTSIQGNLQTFARSSNPNSLNLSALQVSNNTSAVGNGLYAEYYDNKDFTNLKLIRIDPTVNFNWGTGSPDPSIGADTFSVRWTGQIEAKYNETYTFYTTTDDGVRLWVDNTLIVNRFVNQSAKEVSGAIALQAGKKYDIKLEYYENTVFAMSRLAWSSASQTKEIIPQSQLFTDAPLTTAIPNAANITTSGGDSYTFNVTYSDDTAINVATLDSKDILVLGPNGFNQLATLVSIDDNTNGSQRTATYKINAPDGGKWNATNNGVYTLVLQANEVSDTQGNFANTATIGNFNVNIAGVGTGLYAEYYDNKDFTNLKLTRIDPTVNFNWSTDSPDPSIGADTFSVRWTGQIEAKYNETYTFYTTTDDGVRLWIDNTLIVNRFVNQSATEVSGAIALQAGKKYDIKLEYYENMGRAVSRLAWSSASQTKEIIPKSQLYLPAVEPTISLGSSVTTVSESGQSVTINVQRTGDNLSGTSTINYTTVYVPNSQTSAEPGKDYTPVTGTLTFAPGETSKSISIDILDDSIAEFNETFSFVIDQPNGATLGPQRTLTITIEDDDRADLSFTEPIVNENDGTATVIVTRGNSSLAASVDYTTVDDKAKAGSDYTAISGKLDFAPGETTKTISIAIQDDTIGEQDEKFTLKFSNAVGVLLNQDTAIISIIDNDPGNFNKSVITGLNQPTAFDWSPDGQRMYVAQKNGIVRVIENGIVLATPFIDISLQVNNVRDRGLLGIALHPEFGKGTNKDYVYLLYTYDPPEAGTPDATDNALDDRDERGNRAAQLLRVKADPNSNYTTALDPNQPDSRVVLLGKNSTWNNIVRPNDNSTDVTKNYAPSGIINRDTGKAFTSMQDYLNNLDKVQNVEDFIATDSESHSIGTVYFGTDGSLFVSTGDGTSYNQVDPRAIRVQDINNLSGKILRIDPITGNGWSDNPFYDSSNPNSNRSKVWNYGLRNPFRFTVNKNTNIPYIGDVGWRTWEEVNIGTKGANFGWPFYEGGLNSSGNITSLPQTNYGSYPGIVSLAQSLYNSGTAKAPAYTFKHYVLNNNGSDSILVGDFYTGSTFPSIYQNTLFIANTSKGLIETLTFNNQGEVVSVKQFDSGVGIPVQLRVGPDGNLYYVDLGTSSNSGRIVKYIPL